MVKFKIHVQVEIKDKNGKVVKRISKECHSYLRQMIDVLGIQMAQRTVNVKDTGGTLRSRGANLDNLKVTAGAGVDTYGIQVGTGNGAVTIEDYRVYPLIAHGSTSGKLLYLATSLGDVVIINSTAQFTIARTFTNNSGAAITVKEIGLTYMYSYYFMIERSLLEFTIANGESGTVTYTISTTV